MDRTYFSTEMASTSWSSARHGPTPGGSNLDRCWMASSRAVIPSAVAMSIDDLPGSARGDGATGLAAVGPPAATDSVAPASTPSWPVGVAQMAGSARVLTARLHPRKGGLRTTFGVGQQPKTRRATARCRRATQAAGTTARATPAPLSMTQLDRDPSAWAAGARGRPRATACCHRPCR
jgi:hypothetical protein